MVKPETAKKEAGDQAQVVPLYGRDEMNLVEFPLCPISPVEEQTIEIDHEVWDRKANRPIKRSLLITGSARFGLPRPSDEQVLVGLSSLTQQNGFRGRKVPFSQYHLLRTIGWDTNGRAYDRLAASFDRLTGTFLKFSNSWWDNSEKEYRSHGFHLIESYELCSEERYAKHRNRTGRKRQSLNYFVWSDVMWKSIGDGYIRSIDMELFRQIASGRRREVPVRLYRWLGKQFGRKGVRDVFTFDLMRLSEGTMGLAEKYPSQVRRILERAAKVLIDVGFLSDFSVKAKRGGCGFDAVFRKRTKNSRLPSHPSKKAAARAISGKPDNESTDDLAKWFARQNPSELLRAESNALAEGFGHSFEQKSIARHRQKGTPIGASPLRQEYVRRYLDEGFRSKRNRALDTE
ncbi:Replication initiator protein A [Stieleria neptunia]|uniref:Replication initiator protein A n=1 Tax=Stieleria neptunia TaxID=2527979 RepID=A0A518HSR9_9BACT|nr:replication initiator protein A [Stieleria neptunia]QDV43899.1 Replication initiator protein A [Stieleria neptunia]